MANWIRYGLFAVFIAFVIGVLYEAFLLKWRRSLERKLKAESDQRLAAFETAVSETRRDEMREVMKPKCTHNDWRQITEFMRQCRVCHEFDLSETLPEGLPEYLYGRPDPRTGPLMCKGCSRLVPALKDLPQSPFQPVPVFVCPYCNYQFMGNEVN